MHHHPHPGAPVGSPRPPVAVHASGPQQQPLRKMPSAGHLPPPPPMTAAGAPPVPMHYQQQQQQQQQMPPPRQRNRSISRDPNAPPTRSNSGPHPGMMPSPSSEFAGYVYPTPPAGDPFAAPGAGQQGAYQQGPPQHPHYPPPPLPADAYGAAASAQVVARRLSQLRIIGPGRPGIKRKAGRRHWRPLSRSTLAAAQGPLGMRRGSMRSLSSLSGEGQGAYGEGQGVCVCF
ncbi:hypothetical protein BCR44DRAFT_1278023 [Catenaria anguillulae PL171]|uniref:Uncharacterized protein n=1 Tax=Catenaria anguillulae PL171 TaxID=765915 RepID=A0A1Y2H9D5_9FUNG|nr:hypothetical protein BCR44DRAFT_1278023 [Catenaria anguillulae PL171]